MTDSEDHLMLDRPNASQTVGNRQLVEASYGNNFAMLGNGGVSRTVLASWCLC